MSGRGDAFQREEEREIALAQGFKQPSFFEEIGMLFVSNPRQVGVQDQRKPWARAVLHFR